MAKNADPVVAMLGTVDIFEGLSKKELNALHGAARDTTVKAGETIVSEGERDRRFYLILAGEAEITMAGNPIRRLHPGDYFGEVSVIDGGERTASVRAITDTTLLTLAHFNIKAIVKEHPEVGFKLLVGLCGVLRRSASRANAH